MSTAHAVDVFGDAQQRELAVLLRTCRDRGASVMLSNSDPQNSDPTDDFFDPLYHDWVIMRVPARRAVNKLFSPFVSARRAWAPDP